MIKSVIKRDGRVAKFDIERIINAIFKAARAVHGTNRELSSKLALKVLEVINKRYNSLGIASVEEIQDIVEHVLIENGHAKTAKAYILYRKQRADVRDFKSIIDEANELMDKYLNKDDWRINENSNTTYSLQGLNNYISSAITSNYWLNKIYPEEIKTAHLNGDFHIHDLNLLAVYCCGWDLKDILLKGFKGVEGKVESAPPKHLRSALGQTVNFFYTLQGEASGAQAISSFDTYLAPFVAMDNLSYNEVKQCMQEFIFNLNIPTRVGFQTPFTNLTLDLEIPNTLKNEFCIVGGKLINHKYSEFQREMDMINKAFIEVMTEGDANGRIFTFPIPTYNITKDFNWQKPIVDNLMEMTSRYGTPYFANFVNSDMNPDDARSMCCRLRLDNRELKKRGGGLFGANPLTGSIGVVTINLPRIGFLSRNENEYFNRLSNLMELAKNSLRIKRKTLEHFTSNNLYPYAKFYLEDLKLKVGTYWGNHFNTIGLIGMNESVLNFMGIDIIDNEARDFTIRVLKFMRGKLLAFQEEDNMLYNLEATPAEGTSYRLAKIDKRLYPDIITNGENEPFYTNSTQLPVDAKIGLFDALTHQNDIQSLYTGGTVFHVFLGEALDNHYAIQDLVKLISENYSIPYFTITPTFSICPIHGYIKGKHKTCPICEEKQKKNIDFKINQLKSELTKIA